MIRLSFLIVLLTLLTGNVLAQDSWVYPPSDLTPELNLLLGEARRQVNLRNFEAAREIYLRLAEENAGTSIGAASLESARMTCIYGNDGPGADSIRQRIIAEYPNSRFEIAARFAAVTEQTFNAERAQAFLAYSDFLEQVGAPRLEPLVAGQNFEQASIQVKSLHPEIQFALASIYDDSLYTLETYEQVANLSRFGRSTFEPMNLDNISFLTSLVEALEKNTGKSVGNEPSRPTITIVSPLPNSTVAANSSIAFTLSSGDYHFEQARLGSLSVKIDGEEQLQEAIISSEINNTLSEGSDFEVLTVTLTRNFIIGRHTVEVLAQTGQGLPTPENSMTANWSFTVSENNGNTDIVLTSTRDVILDPKNYHQSEGANQPLTLQKI